MTMDGQARGRGKKSWFGVGLRCYGPREEKEYFRKAQKWYCTVQSTVPAPMDGLPKHFFGVRNQQVDLQHVRLSYSTLEG